MGAGEFFFIEQESPPCELSGTISLTLADGDTDPLRPPLMNVAVVNTTMFQAFLQNAPWESVFVAPGTPGSPNPSSSHPYEAWAVETWELDPSQVGLDNMLTEYYLIVVPLGVPAVAPPSQNQVFIHVNHDVRFDALATCFEELQESSEFRTKMLITLISVLVTAMFTWRLVVAGVRKLGRRLTGGVDPALLTDEFLDQASLAERPSILKPSSFSSSSFAPSSTLPTPSRREEAEKASSELEEAVEEERPRLTLLQRVQTLSSRRRAPALSARDKRALYRATAQKLWKGRSKKQERVLARYGCLDPACCLGWPSPDDTWDPRPDKLALIMCNWSSVVPPQERMLRWVRHEVSWLEPWYPYADSPFTKRERTLILTVEVFCSVLVNLFVQHLLLRGASGSIGVRGVWPLELSSENSDDITSVASVSSGTGIFTRSLIAATAVNALAALVKLGIEALAGYWLLSHRTPSSSSSSSSSSTEPQLQSTRSCSERVPPWLLKMLPGLLLLFAVGGVCLTAVLTEPCQLIISSFTVALATEVGRVILLQGAVACVWWVALRSFGTGDSARRAEAERSVGVGEGLHEKLLAQGERETEGGHV